MLRWKAAPDLPALVALLFLSAICVFTDRRLGRLPNEVTLTSAVLGLFLETVFGGVDGAERSLLGLALSVILVLPGYFVGLVGGGVVKLLVAVGAIGGPIMVLGSLLAGSLMVLAFRMLEIMRTLLTLNGARLSRAVHIAWLEVLGEKSEHVMPLGTVISIGTSISVIATWSYLSLYR